MATVEEVLADKMKNCFGIQRPMGKNVNDLRWVDQLDTDEYYCITGKERAGELGMASGRL